MATALSITGVDISGQPYGISELGSGPLSSLFNTNATNSYYRYPADLGATQYNNSKNHWVTFSIYDVAPAGYQSSLGYGLSGAVTDAVALSAAGAVIGAAGVGADQFFLRGGSYDINTFKIFGFVFSFHDPRDLSELSSYFFNYHLGGSSHRLDKE